MLEVGSRQIAKLSITADLVFVCLVILLLAPVALKKLEKTFSNNTRHSTKKVLLRPLTKRKFLSRRFTYLSEIIASLPLKSNSLTTHFGQLDWKRWSLKSLYFHCLNSAREHLNLVIFSFMIHRCFIDGSLMFTRPNIVSFIVKKY